MKVLASTHVGNYGQYIDSFTLCPAAGETVGAATLSGHYCDLSGKALSQGILSRETLPEGNIRLTVDPFLYRYDFTLHLLVNDTALEVTKDDLAEVQVLGLHEFEAKEENGVLYRLYSPASRHPRPLILFLHGAGEAGYDNLAQMTGTIGALEMAKRFPDMYVMAPQAGTEYNSIYQGGENRYSREYRFTVKIGMTPPALKGDRGWNRDLLTRVCDIIRNLIDEGKVDPARIYVTGMSMGGCGTIQAVCVAPDLFAAAAPICPTMNGESLAQLMNLPEIPMWITTAYIDHQPGRHAYIMNGCNALWEKGRRDVRFTIFTPEDLAKYGIGTTEGLTTEELYVENHNSWILTMNDDPGVLTWMVSHRKNI